MRLIGGLCAMAVLGLLPPAAVAQAGQEHQHPGAPPTQLGRVVFPIRCTSQAQRGFVRGVALLHSFWYEEAAAAFHQVILGDSACAMGYWGEAMTSVHPLWTPPTAADQERGLAAAERAVARSRPGTRERGYAEAIASYFRDYPTVDHPTRMLAYERAMAELVRRHSWDEEARIFYALALIANGQLDAGDTSYARLRRAADILRPLFARHPDHPGLAHYLIHACDSPALAARGVAAAARYSRIAPSVPHAQHMPSHIYVRLGRWEEAIGANQRSAAAARAFEASRGGGFWDQHGHALDYLVYAYLQEGRDRDARAVVDQASRVTTVFPENSLINDYALAAIPARYALERNDWTAAVALAVRPAPAWRATEAITHFARALGAARLDHAERARAETDSLREIEQALAGEDAVPEYWAGQVRIQRLAAGAWAAWAAGDTAAALGRADSAADLEDRTEKHPVTPGPILPARELYGDLLMEYHRPAEARKAYESALGRQPNRPRSLFGAGRAAQLAGDQRGARVHYQALAAILGKGDGTRPEAAEVQRALAGR